MLLISFTKALRDLFLPGILKILLQCLLAYLVAWAALAWILSALLSAYVGLTGPEGFMVHVLGGFGGTLLAWFLFPLLYPILVSFFDDRAAEIIEHEDYPSLPAALPPFWPTLLQDLLFSLKAIALNILCLPLYLMPVVGIAVYYGLNGYLLGTQFFFMAAGRRTSQEEGTALYRRARSSVMVAGILISVFSTVPLLNLAVPLLGVGTMLHFFHALRAQPPV